MTARRTVVGWGTSTSMYYRNSDYEHNAML